MTNCTPKQIEFPALNRKKIEFSFSGGHISSNGGALLLKQADDGLGLTKKAAASLTDNRDKSRCHHTTQELLRQRVYSMALGYEDLNDHDLLRNDQALRVAVGKESPLASSSTLCRLENAADRKSIWAIHKCMFETFISSFETAPEELILDFDATDDEVHGNQEGRFFHGYYRQHCFLPLHVFCGQQLLVSYLRRADQDAARHSRAILKLLVEGIRKVCPQVKIIFRADSGFCRSATLSWCDRKGVGYIVGLAKNKRLLAQSHQTIKIAELFYSVAEQKQRIFDEVSYAAQSWNKERRVIVKAEHTDKGPNPRFVVTNLSVHPKRLYDNLYCARGEMENRIKELQLQLFSDRTSAHRWDANQFRLTLASLAYVLIERLRARLSPCSELAKVQCDTIRLKLLKIGAVILTNTRRIRFRASSAHPFQDAFFAATAAFNST